MIDRPLARPEHLVHPLFRARRSARGFDPRPLGAADLRAILEAARWAPSSGNSQPWRAIVGLRGDEAFEAIARTLDDGNRRWAPQAGALALFCAERTTPEGAPRRHADHDVGLAVGHALIEAASRGVVGHPMAGFDPRRARAAFSVPEGVEPLTVIAFGWPGPIDALPEDLQAKERRSPTRRAQPEWAYGASWGETLALPGEDEIEDVLRFWFGALDESGLATSETSARWFTRSEAFDREIAERFGALHGAIRRGEKESWRTSARGVLAYVIVLDQLSRNMFRGTPAMFEGDGQALAASLDAQERGLDSALRVAERVFLYMPLMHAEDRAQQERCVQTFSAFADTLEGRAKESVTSNVKFAVAHRDIVVRFGRFPHRNDVLGRPSSDAERAFLKEPGSSF